MQKSSKLVEINPLALIQQERNYRHHLTRLLDISLAKGSLSQNQKNINDHELRLQKNQEYQRRKQNRRFLEIQKENAKLLTKIMEINLGRDNRSSKSQPRIPTLVLESERSVTQQENSPKGVSNSAVNRKKESRRIEGENKRFSERLVLQESSFARERMNRDYQQNREYSYRLRKIRMSSDNIIELGQGAVKFSKDLRVTSHTPYLPPLNPISSAHTHRASSVSRLHADISSRSATKVAQSVLSVRNRQKVLKTEIETAENVMRTLERCQSSPNYQGNGSVTDRAYGRSPSPYGKKTRGGSVKGSPVKYRKGEFIFENVRERSIMKSSQSRRTQEEKSLIREESQVKEESVQKSRIENFESGNVSEMERKELEKGGEERQMTEEYEQAYEVESGYESKVNNGKMQFKSNAETEEYVEDYESLAESQKTGC